MVPQIVVSIKFICDMYLDSNVSDQIWQVSDGEVFDAWDVDTKDIDGSTTRRGLDCDHLGVRVNPNHFVIETFLPEWPGLRPLGDESQSESPCGRVFNSHSLVECFLITSISA